MQFPMFIIQYLRKFGRRGRLLILNPLNPPYQGDYRFFARLLNMNNLTNKRIEEEFERPMRLCPMLRSEAEKNN